MNYKALELPAEGIFSLCWTEDHLVDWVGRGHPIFLDKPNPGRSLHIGFRFDAAVVSPSGTYAAVYEKGGTKALLLKEGLITQELNRSFYHANHYEYPITFGRMPNGKEILIHCPEDYNRLEITDVETGESLTDFAERKPGDIFHSRLAVSSNGKYLLSAGWVWHPLDSLVVCDLESALLPPEQDEKHPIDFQDHKGVLWDVSGAAFFEEHRVIFSTALDTEDEPYPNHLKILDIPSREIIHQIPIDFVTGTLFPIDEKHVVAFHEHPRLVEIETGKVIEEWPEISTGQRHSSLLPEDPLPPLALHPSRPMFAVADKEKITVISFE